MRKLWVWWVVEDERELLEEMERLWSWEEKVRLWRDCGEEVEERVVLVEMERALVWRVGESGGVVGGFCGRVCCCCCWEVGAEDGWEIWELGEKDRAGALVEDGGR